MNIRNLLFIFTLFTLFIISLFKAINGPRINLDDISELWNCKDVIISNSF